MMDVPWLTYRAARMEKNRVIIVWGFAKNGLSFQKWLGVEKIQDGH